MEWSYQIKKDIIAIRNAEKHFEEARERRERDKVNKKLSRILSIYPIGQEDLRRAWKICSHSELITLPEQLRGFTCGAKTRGGRPCRLKSLYDNGRCKFHGGLSTGPRTKKGKKRSSLNWKKRKIFKAQETNSMKC
jgi:hypothetical protein